MPTYQREVRVAAPLDEVWAFHSRVEGLQALTPDWMGLRVEAVRGPDGRERDHDAVLEAGTEIRLSVRPFGVGPRRSWTSRIVRRDRDDGAAVFEDEMIDGPFPEWHHRHAFFADSEAGRASNASGERGDSRADETLVRDRVTYELPVVGGLFGPLGWLGFEPMFRERHRRTRRLLEGRAGGPAATEGSSSPADHQGSE